MEEKQTYGIRSGRKLIALLLMLTLISLVNLHVELSIALEINLSRHVDVFRAAAGRG